MQSCSPLPRACIRGAGDPLGVLGQQGSEMGWVMLPCPTLPQFLCLQCAGAAGRAGHSSAPCLLPSFCLHPACSLPAPSLHPDAPLAASLCCRTSRLPYDQDTPQENTQPLNPRSPPNPGSLQAWQQVLGCRNRGTLFGAVVLRCWTSPLSPSSSLQGPVPGCVQAFC